MDINKLLQEYSLELNDIRWYLATNLAFSLTEMSKNKDELIQYISSGQLEVDLYNMEEKYIGELEDLSERNKIDEVNIREVFNKVMLLRKTRITN